MAIAYIESWTQLKDDERYVNMLLCTLRSIFTYLKNLQPSITRHKEMFVWAKKHDLAKPVRFDTIERNVKKETHKNLYNSKYNDMMKEYNKDLENKANRRMQTHKSGGSIGINPSDIRL
jgi:hypothetical protein